MQHNITLRNMLAYLCLSKWCCIVACKQTKDKHFRECARKIALTSIFSPKCTKYRLAAWLRPDPLGRLQRSPRPPRL